MLLLKGGEYEQALEECLELDELYKSLYGENSLQYAKNLKVIGTILLILNRYPQAYEYYSKAMNTFKGFKNTKKIIKEIKDKLTTISENMKSVEGV